MPETYPQRLSLIALLPLFILLFATSLFFGGCSSRSMTSEEASPWIAAFTPSRIDRDSKIRIEFTELMTQKIDTNTQIGKYIRFSPSIKGKAYLSEDKYFLDFVPDKSLKQGKEYKCTVRMSELTGVDSLADFEFKFFVQNREIKFADVKAVIDPDNTEMIIVSGKLEYNFAAGDSMTADSKIINCDYPDAKIRMNEKSVNNQRGFNITGIRRNKKEGNVTISINQTDDFKSVAKQNIIIPSIDVFILMSAERVDASEPYINLEFSSPISSQQDPEGIITIDKISDLKFDKNGTNIKVYYPSNGIADLTLRISDLLKNNEGISLEEDIECHFPQKVIPPEITLPIDGNLLPDQNDLKLPFSAVNLVAVDVEVVKLFPNNVMSFLQANDWDDYHSLNRYGRLVYHKTVRLDTDKSLDLRQWQNFSIGLENLFHKEKGAVYNIRLSFKKSYSLYDKAEPDKIDPVTEVSSKEKDISDKTISYLYRTVPEYSWDNFNWNEIDDPSSESYYMDDSRMPQVNLVASSLGLIVKKNDSNDITAVVTDLISALPAGGIKVTAYNYQLQPIGERMTDANGFANFKTESKPFIITASDGESTTYLKVSAGREISTSNFNVEGKRVATGIKGFTYGERGVWRPGDDIHLTLVIEDKEKKLPANHPVVLELYNPAGQLYDRQTITQGVDGFYVFDVKTDENVPTGLWDAQFKVGNETFRHKVRIETIKPNRLKVDIDAPSFIQANQNEQINLYARWLTGPPAKDMNASVEVTIYTNNHPFDKFKNFTFRNPLSDYTTTQKQLFSGKLDSMGNLKGTFVYKADINSPGMFLGNVVAKVTEPGGDASIVSKSVPFSPFGVYVGIDLTKKEFETEKEIKLPVVAVNQIGSLMKTRELEYKIYKLDWSWWWEGGPEDLNRYMHSSTVDLIDKGNLTAVNGRTSIPLKIEDNDWGKYLVIIRDIKGGHATGGVIRVDSPEWNGRSAKGDARGSREFSFTLDKSQYEVGETAKVYLPKCEGGKVLLSVENGSGVVKKTWVSLSGKEETSFPLAIEKNMTPNFYVSASLIRPHRLTGVDNQIRLFGVQSVKVVDKGSLLHPVIEMPDKLSPQQQFTLKVKEKDNKPMTYTIAIVDEGLLDITDFKTPDIWNAMNQKEALGVKTFDMFDDVIGCYGSGFRQILSIGGDEALRKSAGKEKRFNPAVVFLGPFTLESGTRSHKITLPNYIGSVRAMVIAGREGRYGNADVTVKVTSPLMVLPTLPATLANCDSVIVPVNVFALDKNIRNVDVSVNVSGPLSVVGSGKQTLTFSEEGEKLVNFKLACDKTKEGEAMIVVTASGNGKVIRDTTGINVFNPMPQVIETMEKTLSPKNSVEFDLSRSKTGFTSLQLSGMPALNFKGIDLFWDSYPHLCTEQLTSKAMFMLFGRQFLNEEDRRKCEKELPRVIKAILSRQISDGSFSYWQGMAEGDQWVTSMAGVALSEASNQGFRIDEDCLERWKAYQEKAARDYKYSARTDLIQAYRLYSLAVAGSPLTSSMNRLRESKKLSKTAAFSLASAYAETGRKDVAEKLISRGERSENIISSDAFASTTRDNAIELQAYSLCGMLQKALQTARKVTAECNGEGYVSQNIAFASIAMSYLDDIAGKNVNSVRISEQGKNPFLISGFTSIKEIIPDKNSDKIKVENTGEGTLTVSMLTSYFPSVLQTVKPVEKGLKLSISYFDLQGLPVSVKNLVQDKEFKARITVSNMSDDKENMALTYAVPSGWEIWNDRLYGYMEGEDDYRDVRDNSSHFYFSIKKGASKTFEVRLRAAFKGTFILPPIVCEDMYNPACKAMTSNSRITVI